MTLEREGFPDNSTHYNVGTRYPSRYDRDLSDQVALDNYGYGRHFDNPEQYVQAVRNARAGIPANQTTNTR